MEAYVQIAFRLFLFFVAMLLVLVTLAGFVPSWFAAGDVTDNAGISGSLAEQIRSAFDQPGTTRWVALLRDVARRRRPRALRHDLAARLLRFCAPRRAGRRGSAASSASNPILPLTVTPT